MRFDFCFEDNFSATTLSIHFISGKPGGGKTLYSVRLIVDELVRGERVIVTNVPLLLGRLNEYLQEKYPKAFKEKFEYKMPADSSGLPSKLAHEIDYTVIIPPHITDRIILILEDDLTKFFTFRGGGVRLQSISNADWKQGKRPDYSLIKDAGVFYVLDEVHIAFNSRGWADTGAEVLNYLSQHRKLGDDVVCITQSVNNVDKQFRSVAQDYTYIKNLSKQKVGWFRLPAMFTRNTYAQPATDTSKPMESGQFTLDVSGLASCYDTAMGVGIHGRSGADTNARKKGLHWAWVIVGLICLGVFLKYLPAILNHFLSHKKSPPLIQTQLHKPAHETEKPESPTEDENVLGAPKVRHQVETNELYCDGYTLFPSPEIFMSDGTSLLPVDGLEKIGRNFVIVSGKKIPMRKKPDLVFVPTPVVIFPQPSASPPRPVNDAEILPAIHANLPTGAERMSGIQSFKQTVQ